MRRPNPKINKNILDKVIEYISPVSGARRIAARTALALSGSYKGASKSRRQTSEWLTSKKSADSDILGDLPTLRERSRDLVRNAPLAGGAISTVTTNVVGTGLKLHSRIDKDVLGFTTEQSHEWETVAEREWKLWANSKECDITRQLNFDGMTELVFRQTLENGDVFVTLPRKSIKMQPYNLRMQIIEADRVTNEDYKSDNDEMAGGITKDKSGEPKFYHILEQHPGNMYSRGNHTWKNIPAYGKNTHLKNVIHLYKIIRPGQTRGVPYLAPVMESLKMLDQYTEAEVMAAVVAGMFTVFIKSESAGGADPMVPTSETGGASTDDDYKLAPGAILELGPEDSVDSVNPGRPNTQYDAFVMSVLRMISVALEMPFEIMIKHFTASYSASRAAILEAWKFFKARRKWLIDNFCNEIYEIWMYEAVAKGRIYAPGFFTDPILRQAYLGAEWVGPAKGMIDELKEVKAAAERVELGISNRQIETSQLTGHDYDKVHAQLVKENEMRKELAPVVDEEQKINNQQIIDDEDKKNEIE